MPAPQTEQENCVAHNGSLIPGAGPRHHGAGAGIRAACRCSTSPTRPSRSRSPTSIAARSTRSKLITGGYWSAYWYNGHIYGSEIARGVDVFRLTPSEFLSQNEIDAALLVQIDEFNAQQQPKVDLAGDLGRRAAYLDQLTRARAIAPDRASAIASALESVDKAQSSTQKNNAASELETLAKALEGDAGQATGRDAMRLRSLAATMRGRVGAPK